MYLNVQLVDKNIRILILDTSLQIEVVISRSIGVLPSTSSEKEIDTEIKCPTRKATEKFTSSKKKCSAQICAKCSKCRCKNCIQPQTLPSKWICNGTCLLSSDCIVDSLSCMCCVKAANYHCRCWHCCIEEKDKLREASSWRLRGFVDTICIIISSFFLPCLCCYFPMRLCQRCVESAYSFCTYKGCRCKFQTFNNTSNLAKNSRCTKNSSLVQV